MGEGPDQKSAAGTDRQAPSDRRSRDLAMVAMAAGILLVLLIVSFVLRNGVAIALGLVGLVVGIAGGWWVITEHSMHRVVGYLGVAIGMALMVVALLLAGQESWASAVRAVLALLLLSVAIVSARASLATRLLASHTDDAHRVPPPSHPVLLCNPWSGGGKVERFRLQDLATSLGVETIMLEHGIDLGDLARGAIARGADCLGMAGGDGSQALVASLAVDHALPFVCVSAGTRNHFALDLGLDREDPRKSVYAFRDAIERRVDYATVNGRFFVNNVSLGVYATVVQQVGYREAKAETTQQLLPELLGQRREPFDLQFVTPDGTEVDGAFLIMVSNNPYVLGASPDASQRRRLDAGRLGVFAVSARTGTQAAEVITLALAGRGGASGHAYQFDCDEFEVHSRSGTAYAGIDGEALELVTPLRFRIHPKGLRMLVPQGNLEAALRRQAREVHISDLMQLARGSSSRASEPR
jgi:diacylglycerol kinase family enzyme